MSNDVSGFGARVTIIGSATFPSGFTVSQFADDADPFDIPSVQIKDKAMGVNGDLVTWSKANPCSLTLNVIPNSDDDKNLAALFDANRVGKGKQSAGDVITINVVYPDGKTKSFTQGTPTDYMPGTGLASSGRLKSKPYAFAFENVNG